GRGCRRDRDADGFGIELRSQPVSDFSDARAERLFLGLVPVGIRPMLQQLVENMAGIDVETDRLRTRGGNLQQVAAQPIVRRFFMDVRKAFLCLSRYKSIHGDTLGNKNGYSLVERQCLKLLDSQHDS